MTFNETELAVISNALRVAAETFQADSARIMREYGSLRGEVKLGIVQQFARQEHDARALHDEIAKQTGIAS